MPRNRLAEETSPYLLQHADNPVDWMPWGPEALERARAEDKPILLSVGYAACHWCHVMAHESFEDDGIAALMNELFVNIKVDREERPDLDTIYQSALAMLGQQGGWPLTMFLRPSGEPFWGGTYFPATSKLGRPAFPEVLRAVAETYRSQPETVDKNSKALREGLDRLAQNRRGGDIDRAVLDQVAQRLVREIDPVWGGIGMAPKFPQVPILTLLWRAYWRTGRDAFREAVTLSLTRMCQGGIYDHLGGGFARYSTDTEWLAPHFEKMLYDNAQLVELLSLVWQATRAPLLEARLRETIGWVLSEMRVPGGGFASSLDADSEGEEGRYYVWSEAEIDHHLGPGPATERFKQLYDVSPGGNWEGKVILNRRRQTELADADTEATLAAQRQILLDARAGRVRPGWDDKVLADWNGLMIAALVEAGQVFDEPGWLDAAREAYAFVRTRMTDADGRLFQAWRDGKAQHPGTLDAHANMMRAALSLYEASSDPAYLDHARAWAAVLDRHFWDPVEGGYFLAADDTPSLIVRSKSAGDASVPAGNGTLVGVMARLHHWTGEAGHLDRAHALVTAFSGELTRNFFPLTTFLNNVELLANPLSVVVRAAPDDAAAGVLTRTVLNRCLPSRMMAIVPPERILPSGHPAAGKPPLDGRATAYVCPGMSCLPPVDAPAALADALEPYARPGGSASWP